MKTILAPIDFSSVTETVVREAAAIARAVNARVVLLSVIQPPVTMNEYAAMIDLAEIIAAGEKNAARQLEAIEEKLRGDFITVESAQVVGAPVAHILREAAAWEADYIVMGSHGHTAFYDLLVGSTTHGVLMRAQCPVIIVPAAKEELAPQPARQRQTALV